MKRLSEIVCLVELALLVLFPLFAWTASVLGFNVVNLLSEDSLRWLFLHAAKALVSNHLALFILFLSSIGALQESGLWRAVCASLFAQRRKLLSQQERHSLLVATLFFIVVLAILLCPVFLPHNALRSVTGQLFPSPWIAAFPIGFCVELLFSCVLFCAHVGRLGGFLGIPRLLGHGIDKYSIWIVDAMMLGLLIEIFRYSL